MTYVRETNKSVDEAAADVEAAVQKHNFGVLHIYDFKETLHSKGFELANECRVLEVCNPGQASLILNDDMSVNMALPCRVSVYEDGGKTFIGMIPPTDILNLISESDALRETAEEVEKTMIAIIEDSI